MEAESEQQLSTLAAVLSQLSEARRSIDALEHLVVALVRDGGATWEDIGEHLGISRQAAQRRFGVTRKRQR